MIRAKTVLLVLFVAALALVAQLSLAQEAPWTARDNLGDGYPPGDPSGTIPAADIIFTPDDAAHPVCPPFGACPPAMQITDQYLAFGVDFTVFDGNPPVGVFTDPPDKFGGVNGAGNLDLLTNTCGRIVVVGTQTQGATDLVGIEAGFVGGPNDLLLEVYDVGGAVIGSSIADAGIGADGDLVAFVQLGSPTIASFCVITPTQDTYGLRRIHLNDPTGGVPAMGSAALLAVVVTAALIGLLALDRRRRAIG